MSGERVIACIGDAVAPSRRCLLLGFASALATGLHPALAAAKVPVPYDRSATPPMDSRVGFIDWMQKNRGEDSRLLGQRWDRFQMLLTHQDVWDKRKVRCW
jgi:protein-L-isoaspartate(D-aspartate) O-methyltransferase